MTFIDLFAGIGGFHLAMHRHGFECVFASEIDSYARQTYEHNFKKISPSLFKNGMFNEDITNIELDSIADFDILCAGFPCQPFSTNGLGGGLDDARGTLFFHIMKLVKHKIDAGAFTPKVLFFENVKGLKSHDKGNTLKIIKKLIYELGYKFSIEVLNSKYFGLPQSRERLFIVAWHADSVKADRFHFPYGLDDDGQPIYDKNQVEHGHVKTRLGDILLTREGLKKMESESGKSYTITEKMWDWHRNRKEYQRANNRGFGYSLVYEDSPYTRTLVARYYKDGAEILIDQSRHDLRPRKLHPVEAARLQGYPVGEEDGFEIVVSDTQAYKQFGNAVPVPVIQAITKEIKDQLLSEDRPSHLF